MISTRTKARKINIKNIIFSSMFIVSIIFVMISVSFSWFMHNKTATVSGINVNVVDAENLVIKEVDGDWSHRLDIFGNSDKEFEFKQVTGDGVSFYSPIQEVYTLENTSDEYTYENHRISGVEPIPQADLSEYVYIYDFSAKIEGENDMYLAECTASGRGAAVLRLALMVNDGEGYRTELIWIPDVTTKLNDDGSVSTDETESEVYFRNENNERYSVAIEGSEGHQTIDGVKYVWGNISANEHKIAALLADAEVELRLVIWLEGDDRDCRSYVSLGDVDMNFNFTAIKETAE